MKNMEGQFLVEFPQYNIPDPPSILKHKRRSVWDIFLTWFIMNCGSAHICQICKRVEQSSRVSGWLQIDHPIHKDKDGCSSVCSACARANPGIFSIPIHPKNCHAKITIKKKDLPRAVIEHFYPEEIMEREIERKLKMAEKDFFGKILGG